MEKIDFNIISAAWKRMISNPAKLDDMRTEVPGFANPQAIRLKLSSDDEHEFRVRFYGFDAAVDGSENTPLAKRMILNWMKRASANVQVVDSMDTELNLLISKTSKFNEAAITIFRRDPKTNKVKRAYKCIGGRKDGRRVSDPNQCLQYPDVAKKMSLSISRRAKYGQSKKSRTKTKLTNIVSKRVRKANARMKKARGF